MLVREQPGQRGSDRRDPLLLGDHRQREPLPQIRLALAHAVEKAQVLGEAPERDVLTVVGRRVGISVALRQRLHRASERRSGLVQGHLDPGVEQLERGGEPREPAADDGDLHATGFAGVMRLVAAARDPRPRASRASRGGTTH